MNPLNSMVTVGDRYFTSTVVLTNEYFRMTMHYFRYFGFITKHPLDMRFACHVFQSMRSTKAIAEVIGSVYNHFKICLFIIIAWQLHIYTGQCPVILTYLPKVQKLCLLAKHCLITSVLFCSSWVSIPFRSYTIIWKYINLNSCLFGIDCKVLTGYEISFFQLSQTYTIVSRSFSR